MTVGEKVHRWRIANRLSERTAAKLVGVSQPTLRKVERSDVRHIGLGVALAFVRACDGLTLDDFAVHGRAVSAA